MAQLAIDLAFMPQYAKLDPKVRKNVETAFAKFAEHTHAGLHLEKITKARDPRVRTIRIDQQWRGVVLAPDKGDVFCLLAVMNHDDAIAYAASRVFTVNQAIGVIEVRDQEKLEKFEQALEQAAPDSGPRLFDHVSDKDLRQLGIDRELLPLVRLLATEGHLMALEKLLPEAQFIALLALVQGLTVEQAWSEVIACAAVESQPEEIDTDDLVGAMRRTPGRVYFVEGPEDLRDLLAHPFDLWRVFLHPLQRRVAYKPVHLGPVQVTGGAGTGKTVTALHRARFLAENSPTARVLLTTFTRNLSDTLEKQLDLIVDDSSVRERIDVLNIDRISYAIISAHRAPGIAGSAAVQALFAEVAEETPFSSAFLEREWEQVILAQRVTSEEEYLACSRSGRGVPLNRAQRAQVWQSVTRVTDTLREEGQATFHQMADEAAELVTDEDRYDHVVVDEAQDMHPTQWRLLRALVTRGPNDIFLVGDPHQRIYDSYVSLASLGINVRGRSTRLKLNYRTTQEILTWTVPLLGISPAEGMDDREDTLEGYRSPMHGRRPRVQAYPSQEEELEGLVAQVSRWLEDGIEPHAIGVAARFTYLAGAANQALKEAGIKAYSVKSKTPSVKVDTMHRMKGLEFRCVAVIGAAEGLVPAPVAVTDLEEDRKSHEQDLQKERCLLFVACTRARDHLYVSYAEKASPFLP